MDHHARMMPLCEGGTFVLVSTRTFDHFTANRPDRLQLLPSHWAELGLPAGLAIQIASASGLPQVLAADAQLSTPKTLPGHIAGNLIALDRRYKHLNAGAWKPTAAPCPLLDLARSLVLEVAE
jgi:hypothetical protein